MVISGKLVPKYIIGLIAIVLAVGIFIPTVLLPYLSTRDELLINTLEAQEEILLYENTLTNYDDLQKQVEELKITWEEMEDEMFIKDEYIVNDLSDMMKEVGINPLSIVVSDESEVMPAEKSSTGDSLYSITINMDFIASQETLLEYINYIEERSEGVYIIGNINCSTANLSSGSGDDTVAEGNLITNMTFTAFYFKDVPATATTQPTQSITESTT